MQLETAKVIEVRKETGSLALVRLDGVSAKLAEAYDAPGLKLRLRIGGADGPTDTVALASRPKRQPLDVLVDTETEVGKRLLAAKPGTEVQVSAPFGSGVPLFAERGLHVVLIGRGLGMAAVRAAVLHAMVERGAFSGVSVIMEGSYLPDVPFREEIPAWQRAGITVHQMLSRPDVGKWKDGESAYAHEFLVDIAPDPARTLALVSGPLDLVQGATDALRKLELPPDRVYVFEELEPRRQHRDEPARAPELLKKITAEGTYGSGHQNDAPDHPPVVRTPKDQPKAFGLPRYKQSHAGAKHH